MSKYKNNVLAFRLKPAPPTITEKVQNVLVCSLCESNSFYMVLNDEKQIACSECGYLTTLNWKTKKPSP